MDGWDQTSPAALLESIARDIAWLHAATAGNTARLAALETAQVSLDRLLGPAADNDRLARQSSRIGAEFNLPGEWGFHHLEYDEVGPFRWTGPSPVATLQFFVDRAQPLELRVRCCQAFDEQQPEQVRIFADADELEPVVEMLGIEFELVAQLATRDSGGPTTITIICPRLGRPSDRTGSDDSRALGVAMRWAEIAPPLAKAAPPQVPAGDAAA